VSTIHENLVQRYSEVFRLRAKGQGFVTEIDFELTFSFLVEMEDCHTVFVVLSFNFQVWSLEVFTYSRHVFAEHSFQYISASGMCVSPLQDWPIYTLLEYLSVELSLKSLPLTNLHYVLILELHTKNLPFKPNISGNVFCRGAWKKIQNTNHKANDS